MKQINNGYLDIYYLQEDGNIYNALTGRVIKPNSEHLFYLKQSSGKFKYVAQRTLYKLVYNKPFIIDNIPDLDGEIWKYIKDTDDKYKISNRGRIKSYTKCNAEILKGYQNQAGYDRIDLIIDGKRQTFLVHRLVAAAFLPMPERLDYQLHHKDFDKHNHATNNLEWLSPAEHAKKHAEHHKEVLEGGAAENGIGECAKLAEHYDK